jgi:microcin C transport system substrate-binding protein
MDDSERRKFLPTLIESAKLCGLEYRPEVLEHTTMYRKVMEKNHELCFWAWGATGLQPELWQSHHADNAVEKTVDGLTVAKRQTNNITGTHIPELSDIIDRFRASTDKSEMIQLSFKAQQLIHDEASFIPAFCVPSYRLAYWNWLKWPTHFDVRTSDDPLSTGLFWIDPNEKSRIQTILKRPQWFQSLTPADKLPPTTHIFDQWRTE